MSLEKKAFGIALHAEVTAEMDAWCASKQSEAERSAQELDLSFEDGMHRDASDMEAERKAFMLALWRLHQLQKASMKCELLGRERVIMEAWGPMIDRASVASAASRSRLQ
jgi:hypothetical protein